MYESMANLDEPGLECHFHICKQSMTLMESNIRLRHYLDQRCQEGGQPGFPDAYTIRKVEQWTRQTPLELEL